MNKKKQKLKNSKVACIEQQLTNRFLSKAGRKQQLIDKWCHSIVRDEKRTDGCAICDKLIDIASKLSDIITACAAILQG